MKIALDPYMFRTTPLLDLPGLVGAARTTACVLAWEDRARDSATYMRETFDKYVAT
jgi:hypothetical protein